MYAVAASLKVFSSCRRFLRVLQFVYPFLREENGKVYCSKMPSVFFFFSFSNRFLPLSSAYNGNGNSMSVSDLPVSFFTVSASALRGASSLARVLFSFL